MISVIIPCFNVEDYIDQCLNSLVNQSYNDFEVICVNDGSSDGTRQTIDRFVSSDARFKILNKNNEGQAAARNDGLNIAKGNYIFFLDSDDYIHPDSFKLLMDLFSKNNVDFISFSNHTVAYDYNDFLAINRSYKRDIQNTLSLYCNGKDNLQVNVWSKIYKTKSLNNLRFIEGNKFEDIDFTLSYMARNIKGISIDDKIYYYRIRENSVTRESFGLKSASDYLDLIDILFSVYKSKKYFKMIKNTIITKILKDLIKSVERSPNKNELKSYIKRRLINILKDKKINVWKLSISNQLKLIKMIK